MVVAQRESLEQYNGQSRLTAPYKTADFPTQRLSASWLPIAPQLQTHLSSLCSVILGLGLCKLFPTVPCQRAFYLILPIGGTSGRGEGEKREDTSLFFMTTPPPPPGGEHLPAVAPGGNLLSFSISRSSLSVSHRGSSSSWMEPFPSALRANSTGLQG